MAAKKAADEQTEQPLPATTPRRGRPRSDAASRRQFATRVMPDIEDRFRAAIELRIDATGKPLTVTEAVEEALTMWAEREERRAR